ncbi:DEAD-box ATP-dependent RNA helicase CshC [Galdieria sulphuraria]|uniref:RNA helicase n=1 Tax=Galdieria sulphuraria TaxID=130081 RepID=M2W5R9_GALSU|nr:ATP-dependent RNA helicase [Galdieria sulphuraria]EME31126.1 ATP-dependent RNA helicase [Galdieria sulphuraria]GJD12406.1 DEAD-box ATP-dependent RNA helicase CshC [Galdieria sulphuraria]|eukprot:XP_005707646.1 ATP-dependent RNA helicase [Galdieria sulphuraria]
MPDSVYSFVLGYIWGCSSSNSILFHQHRYISSNVCVSPYRRQYLGRPRFHTSRVTVPQRYIFRFHLTANFCSLIENKTLLENIERWGFQSPLPIQSSAIPYIKRGLDVTLGSHTGSGKTLAFLLPILEGINVQHKQPQVFIIEPTRELCVQIAKVCESLASNMGIRSISLIGGANIQRQIDSLKERQPHIVLGTPGRLYELLIERHILNATQVSIVVIDEVDHCLDMPSNGEKLEALLQRCASRKQTIFCSATCSSQCVVEASKRYQNNAVVLGSEWTPHGVPQNIHHFMITTSKHKHLEAIRSILFAHPLPSAVIIFVNDQHRAGVIASKLQEFKLKVTYMQGNQTKMERAKVLKDFRQLKYPILVCTEVLARGMDFPFVSHVIQLELPTDAQHYLHRAGRCGRAGVTGFCFSIVSPEYQFVMRKFSKALNITIHSVEIRNNKIFSKGREWVFETSNLLPPNEVHRDKSLPRIPEMEAQLDQWIKELEDAETWEDVENIDMDDEYLDGVSDGEESKTVIVEPSNVPMEVSSNKKPTRNVQTQNNNGKKHQQLDKKKRITAIARQQGWVGNRE